LSDILVVRDLVKRFGGVAAVNRASFEVGEGSITALIGPNGAGKTTAFNMIAGSYRPDAGEITFAGGRIDRLPPHRVADRGLRRTFQTPRAFRRMTVLENMLLAAVDQPGERLWRNVATPLQARSRERATHERALELLATVRLDALADAYAGTLSGGQRKLLEFARALMSEPRMMLLDEPMAGVNPTLGLELLTLMQSLRESRGLTFLVIEHDLEAVMMVSDRVLVMNAGEIIAAGTPAEVRADPRVIDAYLGAHYEDPAATPALP
jgi:branched-chain amino acid transport system ATP-binding protein